jgi:hypothetical protein
MKQQRCGAGTSRRHRFDGDAQMVEAFLQVKDNLACLCAKQMLPSTLRAVFDKPDREDIDVPRGDLKNVPAVIEQLRVAAIEYDMTDRANVARLIGHRVEKGLVHS